MSQAAELIRELQLWEKSGLGSHGRRRARTAAGNV